MSKTKEKQSKPEWFNGEIYDEGAVVKNPYSGEEYELNNVELSLYDFVIGATRTVEMLYDKGVKSNDRTKQISEDLHKGLDWFKEHNAKAYMVLLD
tara:strand:+ start:620 stop:907 length:288 start_codon:yes stop_codon:yes gene_type:complete